LILQIVGQRAFAAGGVSRQAEIVGNLDESLAPDTGAVQAGVVIRAEESRRSGFHDGIDFFCGQIVEGDLLFSGGDKEGDYRIDGYGCQAMFPEEGDRFCEPGSAQGEVMVPEVFRKVEKGSGCAAEIG